jgi:polar amino acid transport system substrate-binding protein
MQIAYWLITVMLALALGGCASNQSLDAQTRQALAPTGQLRVAFLSGVLYGSKDSATGEVKGVAVDLGRELARRVGVPFQPVLYPSPAGIIAGAKAGEWDVALMGISAERAAAVSFSAPYMEVEQGYLVRAGVPIATASEVDRPGVRVAVVDKAGAEIHLAKSLKNATLVRTKSLGALSAALESGEADVIAATKTFLLGAAVTRPGSRVLEGRILVEPIGMGVPKGRASVAAEYVNKFVEEAKASGLVGSAIDGAHLRGVAVAPLR